ncbi:MAG TPA: hypothetical protein VIA45_05280 [Thermoanaerobaculia bacterium]
MTRHAGSLLLLALPISTAQLTAQAPPLSDEVVVNAYTTADQRSAAVASDGSGGFVVAWTSRYQDGSDFGVFGQRFGPTGFKVGSEFRVNTYTTGSQYGPSVAAAAGHGFVVVWHSENQDESSYGIFGQRYDDTGAPAGGEFQVNTDTTSAQTVPAVAIDAAGDFVVVWSGPEDVSNFGIRAQRFDSAGVKVGTEFPVNTHTEDTQSDPAIARLPDGGFVVVWTSRNQDGSGIGVFGQRFDGSGALVGNEFAINTYTTGDQGPPAIAIHRSGDFVVVWNSDGQDGSDLGIFGQRFNRAAERVGPEFQINSYSPGRQVGPTVASEQNGGFVVFWTSLDQDGDMGGTFGQRFGRDGSRVGSEFRANVTTASGQIFPAAADTGHGVAVAWDSDDQDGFTDGIVVRRQEFLPSRLIVDTDDAGSSDTNGVLEAGETVVVEPGWRNGTANPTFLAGTAAGLTGPPGATYSLVDAAALYNAVASGAISSCNDGSPNACYSVSVGGTRPATHWDATLRENLSSGGAAYWTLHVGDSFADVSHFQPFYKKIETLLHHGITSGCDATKYCPSTVVARDAMAIFIAKGIAGLGELVPSTGRIGASAYDCSSGGHSLFADVAPTDAFCKHVHFLAAQNVTLGCDATHYCPSQTITRDAMASFIAKATVAPGGGAAVPASYTDPTTARSYSCVSGSANLHFSDVPVSNVFCKHIHYLWAKGIVDGCMAAAYCPGSPVARDAMAKFIANGFGLQLYGP